MRYLIAIFVLIFLPAFGQTVTGFRSDTSIIKDQIRQNNDEMAALVDSLISLKSNLASTQTQKEGTYKRRYNVDKRNGDRVWWVFNYDIVPNRWTGTNDTIFTGTVKYYVNN